MKRARTDSPEPPASHLSGALAWLAHPMLQDAALCAPTSATDSLPASLECAYRAPQPLTGAQGLATPHMSAARRVRVSRSAPWPQLHPVAPHSGLGKSHLGTPKDAQVFISLSRRSEAANALDAGVARRMLLVGPEGAGKKTLAHAVAADLGAQLVCLAPEHSQNPEWLAHALDALDAQACAAGCLGVVYLEAMRSPRWLADADLLMPAYTRWRQTWAAAGRPHLRLLVGVTDARRLDTQLADAAILQVRLAPPDAAVRAEIWRRAWAGAVACGTVQLGFDSETFERVALRPSEGLRPGDVRAAWGQALRTAMLEHPTASQLTVTALHLREGVRRQSARQMEQTLSGLEHLSC